MAKIDFPEGYEETENLPKSRQSLTNLFNNGRGELIARPGITELQRTLAKARGQFVWNNGLYQVISGDSFANLIKITNPATGSYSIIGTVAGTELIVTATGFVSAVIVVKGGAIYTLSKDDVLVRIDTNPNFVPCSSVCHINGRFVYIPTNGDPAFFSDVGAAGTVQVNSFFDAEELPDLNRVCFNHRNTLHIGGTDSFELFRDTGADPVPFRRLEGARIDYGYVGGLLQYADTLTFIGREKDQAVGMYAINQGKADKISNSAIDLMLSGKSLVEMLNSVPARFKWRGYDIATITVGSDSFGFYQGQWFILSKITDGVEGKWTGGFINYYQGEYYSAFGDSIGKLSTVKTDRGDAIPRVIDIPVQQEDNDWFAIQSMSVGISQGFNDTDGGTVGLAVSRNNVEYGDFLYRDLGFLGEYSDHMEWNPPGGLGSYDGFMGVRIYTTQAVDFNANSLFAFYRG